MLVVTGVGLCIFVFATGYMHGDPGFYRFFAYMGLFMFSDACPRDGLEFPADVVGWEGVGCVLNLLIGYYFSRQEARMLHVRLLLQTGLAILICARDFRCHCHLRHQPVHQRI